MPIASVYAGGMSILTREALVCAQRMNLYYSRRLRWPLPRGFRDVQSADFAYHVARMQRDSRRLNVDGIMGPKTDAYVRGRAWMPPVDDTIIVGGEPVTVDFPVVTFENPEGLSFYGQDGWDTRSDPTGGRVDLLVLHWDECISSHHCFHTLLMRRLSAHFLIDGDGTVYQTLDPTDVRAWHARQFNDRAVGIEIQNPVAPNTPAPFAPRRTLVKSSRPHTDEEWHHLDFTPLQHERAMALTTALCRAMNIPMQLPLRDDGQVRAALMEPKFKGVCGHFHLTQDKVDPGMTLWSQMIKAWHPPSVAASDASDNCAGAREESTPNVAQALPQTPSPSRAELSPVELSPVQPSPAPEKEVSAPTEASDATTKNSESAPTA